MYGLNENPRSYKSLKKGADFRLSPALSHERLKLFLECLSFWDQSDSRRNRNKLPEQLTERLRSRNESVAFASTINSQQ